VSTARTWLVSGVSGGIGRAIAAAALARGDTVFGGLRQPLQFAEFERLAPGRALPLQLDVTRNADVAAAAQRLEAHGRLDVLVNNAGIGMIGAVEESTLEQVRALFEINFFGALRLTQVLLPQLRRQRGGHIINMSSGVGLSAFPGMGAYSASKHALEGLSESLAGEVAALGIKVSLVEPGAIRTGFTGSAMLEGSNKLADYALVSGHGRAGLAQFYRDQASTPEAVAEAVLALASQAQPPLRRLVGRDVPHSARTRLERLQELLAQ
jgi:NAD(P)-dependent dehydrogenase (short-subunit alcohol dehydrogenase family)